MLDRDMAFRRRQAGEGDVRVPRGQQVVERRIARPRVDDAAPRAQQLVDRRQRPADEEGGGEDRARRNLVVDRQISAGAIRSEEHTSELQSLMRISYADFCLKKTKTTLT